MGEKWAGGRVVGRWCFDVGGIGSVWFVVDKAEVLVCGRRVNADVVGDGLRDGGRLGGWFRGIEGVRVNGMRLHSQGSFWCRNTKLV